MRLVILCGVASLALVFLAADFSPGRGTPEDTLLVDFPGGLALPAPVGYVAPHPGRLLFVRASSRTAGIGGGNYTLSAVRPDGGVACAVTVPCALAGGAHSPADGGVVSCEAEVGHRELLALEPTSECTTHPAVVLQAAFYYQ